MAKGEGKAKVEMSGIGRKFTAVGLLVLCGLCMPCPVSAADVSPFVYVASGQLDAASTRFTPYLGEANPIGAALYDWKGRPAFQAGTFVLDSVTAWSVWTVVGREHPRVARVLLYGLSGVRVALAMHNARMCNGPRSQCDSK